MRTRDALKATTHLDAAPPPGDPSPMATQTIPASCLCGDVRWEVDGPLTPPDPNDKSPLAFLAMSHCHCAMCRKAHGAPFGTYLAVRDDQFRLTHGRERIVRY